MWQRRLAMKEEPEKSFLGPRITPRATLPAVRKGASTAAQSDIYRNKTFASCCEKNIPKHIFKEMWLPGYGTASVELCWTSPFLKKVVFSSRMGGI